MGPFLVAPGDTLIVGRVNGKRAEFGKYDFYLSPNGGETWDSIFIADSVRTATLIPGTTILLLQGKQLNFQMTTDFGKSWRISQDTAIYGGAIDNPIPMPGCPNEIWQMCGVQHYYLYERSLDTGRTWAYVDLPEARGGWGTRRFFIPDYRQPGQFYCRVSDDSYYHPVDYYLSPDDAAHLYSVYGLSGIDPVQVDFTERRELAGIGSPGELRATWGRDHKFQGFLIATNGPDLDSVEWFTKAWPGKTFGEVNRHVSYLKYYFFDPLRPEVAVVVAVDADLDSMTRERNRKGRVILTLDDGQSFAPILEEPDLYQSGINDLSWYVPEASTKTVYAVLWTLTDEGRGTSFAGVYKRSFPSSEVSHHSNHDELSITVKAIGTVEVSGISSDTEIKGYDVTGREVRLRTRSHSGTSVLLEAPAGFSGILFVTIRDNHHLSTHPIFIY
jgi:hypothetical protein